MNNKGFTLIELIVVIAILGVLALILVPGFMGYLTDARISAAQTNATNVNKTAAAELALFTSNEEEVVDGLYTLSDDNDFSKSMNESLGSEEYEPCTAVIKDGKVTKAFCPGNNSYYDNKGNETTATGDNVA